MKKSNSLYIFEQITLFIKQRFQNVPNIKLVTQKMNNLYSLKIYDYSDLIVFFQIERMNTEIHKLWFYTYEPLEKSISYNAIIKADTFIDSKQTFNIFFYYVINKKERVVEHATLPNIIQCICQNIIKLIGV